MNAVHGRSTPLVRQLLHLLAMVSFTAIALIMTGCGQDDDLPVVIADRTVCSNCKMLVSETVYATAFKVGDEYVIFDDLGCMLRKLSSDPTLKPTKVLVRDQASSQWLDATKSFYVHSPEFKTPMGYGYVSYAEKRTANEASTKSKSTPISGLAALEAHYNNEHAK